MACKEDQFTCGDRVYLVRQMPPRTALPVQLYLAKTVGGPLFRAFAEPGVTSQEAFASAVAVLVERVDDEGLLRSMRAVFRHVGIKDVCIRVCEESDSTGAGIDDRFQGRNLELWKVFVKALEVNFADFFGGALSLSGLLGKLRATTRSTSSTQTGISGGPASVTPSSVGTSDT